MIQAKEYKIGNWIVDWETEEKYFQIEEIRKYIGYEVWVYYRNGSIKCKEPEPIELSEEILLKCGFEKRMGLFVFGYFEIGLDGFDFVNNEKTIRINKCLSLKIKYLHQLQNLIHALTNEELTVIL